MQALSKTAQRLLARLMRDAERIGPGAEAGMGFLEDPTPPRGINDGGGYGYEDKRPDWLREQEEAGWELVVTLSDKTTGRNGR